MDAQLTVKAQITRQFSATPPRIFDAWLDSEIACQWLFARSAGQITRAEIDPRAGGWFYFVERRNGEDFDHMGEYLEMDRPRRLAFIVFAEKYSLEFERVTVEFRQHGTGCELSLTHETRPELVDRLRRDWMHMLDSLATVFGGGGGAAARRAAEELERPA